MTSVPARHHAWALAGVACATMLAHASGLRAGFVFDAQQLVAENPILRAATGEHVRFILTHDYWEPFGNDGLYRPLTVLSYLVDYAVLGHAGRPVFYVLENVLLHTLDAALVYALVFHLAGRLWPAAVAAALFALHPVTTEAVTNVVGRADLLATLGVLAGVLCWAHGTAARGRARVAWAAGLGAAATVAFFSKESGLVLVPAIVLHDLTPGRRLRPRVEHVLLAAVLAGYLAARWLVAQGGFPPEDVLALDNPIVEAGLWTGRLTAARVVVRELALVLWPATLSADYSYRQIPLVHWPPEGAADVAAVAALIAIALLPWGLWRLRRRAPALFFFAAFATVALLPTSNLFHVIGSIMAERFLYLPLVGLAGAAALLAASALRRRVAAAGIGLVLLALGVRTALRNTDWRDELTLWTATAHAAPESAKARKSLAAALFAADPAHAQLARVIAEAERAVAIRPDYLQALADLGGYYVVAGDLAGERRPEEARRRYAQAVDVLARARLVDERATARFREKMLARGHRPDAIPDVGDPTLYNNLALAELRLGRVEESLVAYEALRRLQPRNPEHYLNLSSLLLRLGRWEDAAVALFQAAAIAPGDEETSLRLVEVYRTFDPAGTAVVNAAPDRVRVNLDDPAVHRHRCGAWRGLAEIFTRAQLHDAAAGARREATRACDSAGDGAPATHR